MTEHLSGVSGWNFTKLEVNVVKVSFQDKFVLEFCKAATFLHKAAVRWATAENEFKRVVLPPKI